MRSKKLFKQGHIVHSINIPLNNIFLGDIQEIEIYKCSPIIIVFNETYKYNKCIKKFLEYGFEKVYILRNGLYYWNIDHLPLIIDQ